MTPPRNTASPRTDAFAATVVRWRRWMIAASAADAGWVAVGAATVAALVARAGGRPAGVTWPAAAGAVAFVIAWRRPPSAARVAERLDERFDLADLLGSAWAVRGRRGEPWADALTVQAAMRAAALPRPGGVARFGPRHHACLWAAGAAVWLSAGLTGGAGTAIDRGTAPAARPDGRATLTAPAGGRVVDTADEAARLPAPTDAAAASARSARPSTGDRPARGDGRADAAAATAVATSPPAPTARPQTPAAGGSGAAGPASGDRASSAGVVDDASGAVVPPDGRNASSASGAAVSPVETDASYRDLVRDFFER